MLRRVTLSAMATWPMATPRHNTFFSWNLIEALISSICNSINSTSEGQQLRCEQASHRSADSKCSHGRTSLTSQAQAELPPDDMMHCASQRCSTSASNGVKRLRCMHRNACVRVFHTGCATANAWHTFVSRLSLGPMRVGNLPALLRPGPNRRGICLITESDARNAEYFFAAHS